LLIEHFARLFGERHALPRRAFEHTTMGVLQRHVWPGNVRELRNVIESALLLADGATISVRELPPALCARIDAGHAAPLTVADLASLTFVEARERMLREFDRAFLRAALERHGGNVARTARALGLHRQSLQKLLVRRELRPPNEGLHVS
jgi:DNA-binding NtrC family response regulator